MPKSARLRLVEVKALHELAGECRNLGDDPQVWRSHATRRLATMCGVPLVSLGEMTAGAATLDRITDPGRDETPQARRWPPPGVLFGGMTHSGWDGTGFDHLAWVRLMNAAVELGYDLNPHGRYLSVTKATSGLAMSRADLMSDREWYRSVLYQEYHRHTGADAMLYCDRMCPGNRTTSMLLFVRGAGEPDFTARHRTLAQAAQEILAPLVGGPLARFAEPSPSELPPQPRRVLRCLLEGDSDKQIAARLKLSPYTVNGYVKHVFAHFGVAGRQELLARWVHRGWNGRGTWADDPPAAPGGER